MNRLLLAALLATITTGHAHAADWTTPAEAAHFRTTPSYADTVTYLHKLADAAPGKLKVESFGTSPQGRPLTVVIAGDTLTAARSSPPATEPIPNVALSSASTFGSFR